MVCFTKKLFTPMYWNIYSLFGSLSKYLCHLSLRFPLSPIEPGKGPSDVFDSVPPTIETNYREQNGSRTAKKMGKMIDEFHFFPLPVQRPTSE